MLQIQKLVDLASHFCEEVIWETENKIIVLKLLFFFLSSPINLIGISLSLELCINSTFSLLNEAIFVPVLQLLCNTSSLVSWNIGLYALVASHVHSSSVIQALAYWVTARITFP